MTILVPHLPLRASTAVLKLVIIAGLPVAYTNSIAARTFGPIEPALKCPSLSSYMARSNDMVSNFS